MKRVSILLIVILAINVDLSLGNNVAELYKDFLPKQILKNKKFMSDVSSQITASRTIHPDLIYYKIMELRTRYDQNFSGDKNTYLLFLSDVKSDYLLKRSKWAENQIREIENNNNIDKFIKNKSIKYFNKLLYTKKNDHKKEYDKDFYSIDKNLLNYFVYLYYNNRYERYEADVSYISQRNNFENEKYLSLQKVVTNTINSSDVDYSTAIQNLLSFWYLDSIQENSIKLSGDNKDFYEIVALLLKNKYSIADQPLMNLSVGYIFNNNVNFNEQIDIPELNDKLEIEKSISTPQFLLSFDYRYFVRKNLSILCYLRFKVSAALTYKGIQEDFPGNYDLKYTENERTYTTSYDFIKNDIFVSNIKTFYTQINIPLLAINKHFFLESGVGFGVNMIDYELTYQYSYRKTEGYWAGSLWNRYWYESVSGGISITTNKSGINNDYFVNFILNLIYYTHSGINFNLEATMKYVNLSLGYSF